MKRQIGIKYSVVCVILSSFILAPVLVQGQEKKKIKTEIVVTCPQPNQCVSSPLTVQGKAKSPWFFEASFPIRLVDAQGNQLSASNGKAIGDWTTGDFVAFEGKLDFVVTKETKGKLILENDNPSGLPENARKKEIPVILVPKKK
jgi:hypothetical protein